ncbi:transposase [Nocardia sp. NPDC050793]|uniref:transposase n=1 Tax=Nocardia sp. NPDC050793 TaxID=3155159 RepID=UPI0033F57E0A
MLGHGRADRDCQLGVFCAYTGSKGRTLIDRQLYLPKSWTTDRDHCLQAGVPDEAISRRHKGCWPARWTLACRSLGDRRQGLGRVSQ